MKNNRIGVSIEIAENTGQKVMLFWVWPESGEKIAINVPVVDGQVNAERLITEMQKVLRHLPEFEVYE